MPIRELFKLCLPVRSFRLTAARPNGIIIIVIIVEVMEEIKIVFVPDFQRFRIIPIFTDVVIVTLPMAAFHIVCRGKRNRNEQ